MRASGWLKCLLVGGLLTTLAACDPYTLFSTRRPAKAPPPGQTTSSSDQSQQIRTLKARVQELERQLAEREQGQTAPPAAPARPPAPKQPPVREMVIAPPPAPKAPAPPPPTASVTPGAEKMYTEGMRLYKAKKYRAARNNFAKYLKAQPRGAKAAEARFYQGDSFCQEKKYREANVEFNKLVLQYPKSILAPSALLRQAYSYQELNQKNNSRASLQQLLQRYPRSPEAQEARKLLKPAGTSR